MSDHFNTLRRDADSRGGVRSSAKKKSRLPTLAQALPWLLLAAFLFVAWLLFGEHFARARSVELVKVVTLRASAEPVQALAAGSEELYFEGATRFQASGWIESDPLPIRVTTLYSGVVKAVHVLQGEEVVPGQLLATMVDEDARLDVQSAQANLAQAQAELEQHHAAVAASEAALDTLGREIAVAESRRAELSDQSERLDKAGQTVFRESEISQARLRLATQQRTVEALHARGSVLSAQVRGAQAAVGAATARLEQAQVELARRQLALDRTQVRSPVAGRVQELYAAPGMKRMLNMDGLETASIATIFQSDSLQARIDVPLEEAAQLSIGQAVRLRSPFLPNRIFHGQVSRIDGQADLQRNTLQAKVQLLDPDPQLRPEMLCRAEFLAAAGELSGAAAGAVERVAIYVPESALSGSGSSRTVWALAAGGQMVEQRSVRVAPESRDGHLRVLEGLRPGDIIVHNPPDDLTPGERVKDIER